MIINPCRNGLPSGLSANCVCGCGHWGVTAPAGNLCEVRMPSSPYADGRWLARLPLRRAGPHGGGFEVGFFGLQS